MAGFLKFLLFPPIFLVMILCFWSISLIIPISVFLTSIAHTEQAGCAACLIPKAQFDGTVDRIKGAFLSRWFIPGREIDLDKDEYFAPAKKESADLRKVGEAFQQPDSNGGSEEKHELSSDHAQFSEADSVPNQSSRFLAGLKSQNGHSVELGRIAELGSSEKLGDYQRSSNQIELGREDELGTSRSSEAQEKLGEGSLEAQGKLGSGESADLEAEKESDKQDQEHYLATIFQSIQAKSLPENSSISAKGNTCEGRYIYMYDLPAIFNDDLVDRCDTLLPWTNLCAYVSNSGMGKQVSISKGFLVPQGKWYKTHQYALELIFHARMRRYSCLTSNPEEASLFYVPYFGGLDVMRWHFNYNATKEQKDELGIELVKWLEKSFFWRRYGGADHFVVLGKISWDFRRLKDSDLWGSSLLILPEMQKMTKLLIERHPWHENDVGVPHPTYFHPDSDMDIRLWQRHISSAPRKSLVCFAGQARPNQKESIRSQLIEQCIQESDSCSLLDCGGMKCFHPEYTMNFFVDSEFCMQPPGDSPTRRSVFDSLIAGCIPVFFNLFTAYYQYPWHLPSNRSSYSAYIPEEDVRSGRVNVVQMLKKITPDQRQEIRSRIIYEIVPKLIYASPHGNLQHTEDAFDVSIKNLLHRVSSLVKYSDSSPS